MATKKIDLTIEEAADDMKLSLWRVMQGIKDEKLLVSVLSRVVAKELSFEEMDNKQVRLHFYMGFQII